MSQPGGGRVVYSEEICLVGPAGAEAHFGAMVRALQVPGVPTATLWMDARCPPPLLTRELLPVTRRLIVDTGSCSRIAAPAGPRSAGGAHEPAAGRRSGMAAVGQLPTAVRWPLRSAGGRRTVAERDAAGGSPPSGAVTSTRCWSWPGWGSCSGGGRSAAGRPRTAACGSSSIVPSGGSLEAFVIPSAGACDQSAILSIELTSGHDEYVVTREAIDQARVQLPIARRARSSWTPTRTPTSASPRWDRAVAIRSSRGAWSTPGASGPSSLGEDASVQLIPGRVQRTRTT